MIVILILLGYIAYWLFYYILLQGNINHNVHEIIKEELDEKIIEMIHKTALAI